MSAVLTLARWSVPHTSPERRRWLLTALAVAVWAGLVLVALQLSRAGLSRTVLVSVDDGGVVMMEVPAGDGLGGYSNLVQDPNIRIGFVLSLALTSVAPLALGWQAVRVGSTQRSRRLAQLRVAGASPGQLRLLAWWESAGAALAGTAVAAVVVAVLSALTPRFGWAWRVLTPSDRWSAPGALAVAVVASVAAGAAGAWTLRAASIDVDRPGEPSPRRLPRSRAWASLALLGVLVAGLAAWFGTSSDDTVLAFGLIAALTALAFTAAPYASLGVAALVERRGDAVGLLAAERLRADPRTPARAAAVMLVAGAVLAGCVVYLVVAIHEARESSGREGLPLSRSDDMFYVAGGVFAMAGAAVAALVAGVSTLVGASEQLVTGRRAFAALSAFGVTATQLRRVLRLQTTSVATVAGQVGCLVVTVPCLIAAPAWWMLGLVAGGHLLVLGLTWLGGTAVVALLRPQVLAALDASALRTT
ncbi:MAG: hypothetical protein U0Q15_01065 [Kineosporiaceae bacterium]